MTKVVEHTHKKNAILKAAKEIFANYGYKATSIMQIAKAAGIAKSLIYHHFADKAALWSETKIALYKDRIEAEVDETIFTTPRDVRSFIANIVGRRFAIYEDNPLLAKMMNWQRLEEDKEPIQGRDSSSPDAWLLGIKHLQKNDLINKSLEPEMLLAFIRSVTTGVFLDDYYNFSCSKEGLDSYKKNIIDWMVLALEKN